MEGLRDREVGEVARRAIDAARGLEGTLGDEHPHDLHGVQGDAIGAGDDAGSRVVRQARDETRQELADRGRRERLEGEAREAPLPCAPIRPRVEQLRTGQGHDVDREASAPLDEVVDEREEAAVGPLEIFEDHRHRTVGGDPLEERAPRREELVLAAGRRVAHAEERQERGLDPSALALVGHPPGGRLGDPAPDGRLVVGLDEPGPLAGPSPRGPRT